ncbi:hypothetical protein B6N60_00586 [Richelia sinica FACHB-800]|uniref:Uncharacterized protein n=1 Tax=Richelia sinica FACHB-800 TaxID=1357546 RepID=A0A975T5P1_9NOST|nr:hypothetical protein B6N60_00586 [Richelia sinica FACHB-800]
MVKVAFKRSRSVPEAYRKGTKEEKEDFHETFRIAILVIG